MKKVIVIFFMLMVATYSVTIEVYASSVEENEAYMAEAKAATVTVRKKLPLVGDYLEQTYINLQYCKFKMELGENLLQCIDDAREITTSHFKKALSESKNKNIRQALKEHHLQFTTALNGIRPEPEELKIDYYRRQAMLRGAFFKTLARFDVELY